MKIKLTLTLSLCFVASLIFAQTQTALNKKPGFFDGIDKTVSIPNYGIAMVVKPSKSDFAVTMINENAQSSWIKEFKGFPLTIGYFKKNIVVIAATERTSLDGAGNKYLARVLDPSNGELLAEKIIYEGSNEYRENRTFFFKNDGSQLMFIAAETNYKKGLKIEHIVPLAGLLTDRKDERNTIKNYSLISYDQNLAVSEVFTPNLPSDKSFQQFITENGNLIIASLDNRSQTVDFELYDRQNANAISKASLKINDAMDLAKMDFRIKYNEDNKSYYLCIFYENVVNQKKLIVGKFDFPGKKITTKEEVFDKETLKNISENHTVVNKKLDDFKLKEFAFFNLQDFKVINDKIAAELTVGYFTRSSNLSYYTTESSFIKFYDGDLTFKFNTILPRFSYTSFEEGTYLKYVANKNILNIITNTKDGQSTFIPVRLKVDLNTGSVISYEKLPSQDLDNSFYANTLGINTFSNNKILIPYVERHGGLKRKYDIMLQIVNLE